MSQLTQADVLQGILLAALERAGEGLAEADGSVDEETQDEVDAIAAQATPENIAAILAEFNPVPEQVAAPAEPAAMSLYTPPVISDAIRRKVREQADRAFALSMGTPPDSLEDIAEELKSLQGKLEALADDDDEESTADLASWYAEHWNHLAEMGQAVPDDEMETAGHELTGGDIGLWLDPDTERWEVVPLNDKVQLSQERSPAGGGVTIAGRHYPGGQFIPASVVANATPEEKATLEQAKTAAREKRTSRGSVDTAKLKEGLAPHSHHELGKDDLRRAKAAFRGLHRHHEDLTVHRIEELVDSTQAALNAIPEDHPNVEGLREHFGRRLKAYEHMLEWAGEKGVTGKVEGGREKVTEDKHPGDGSIVEDGDGKQYLVMKARHGLVQVVPIVDGKAIVNREERIDFIVGKNRTADSEASRTDPLYSTGRNYYDELEKAKGVTGEVPEKVVEAPKAGQRITVNGVGDMGPFDLEVKGVKDGKVQIGSPGTKFVEKEIPLDHYKTFVDDLSGRVDVPVDSGNPDIDAVAKGEAEFLGKGQDGLAFRVGDKVVKASTIVPLIPTNPFDKTPEQAAEQLRQQTEISEAMREAGVPGILPTEFMEHGGKGFQIRPYVDVPKKLNREQLEGARDILDAMHAAGYSLNDDVQVGIQDGKPVFFDTGAAEKLPEDKYRAKGKIDHDKVRLENLFEANGESLDAPKQPSDPLDLTPKNISGVWEREKKAIADSDKTMSPNQAGSIAAAKILNAVGKRAAEYRDDIDAKVKRGESITDAEDAKYIEAEDLRKNLYNKLVAISGYRPMRELDENPLAQGGLLGSAHTSPPITHLEPSGPTPGIEPEGPSASVPAVTPERVTVDELAGRKADAATESTYKDKPGVQLLRAPAGGQVSDVNGEFYKGGRIMPVHGLTPKKEKTETTGTASGGPVVGNEGARKLIDREPRAPRQPMTPEQIEEERQRREEHGKWSDMLSGPLGRLKHMGEKPNEAEKYTGINLKDWKDFAEEIGEDKLKELQEKLEPEVHAKIARDDAEYRVWWAAKSPEEQRWHGTRGPRENEEELNKQELHNQAEQDAAQHGMKKHLKTVPSSAYVRQLLEASISADSSIAGQHRINQILEEAEGSSAQVAERRAVREQARPHGFIPNRFAGYAADGSRVKTGKGFVRKETDGKWKTYSTAEVEKVIEDDKGPQEEPHSLALVDTAPLSLVSPYRPPGYDDLHDAIRNIEGQLMDIARREPQHVIVPAPVVHVTMPAINVAAPAVTVNVPERPVTVNVEPADVTVNLPAPGKTTKTVSYDSQGRPASITEQPVEDKEE